MPAADEEALFVFDEDEPLEACDDVALEDELTDEVLPVVPDDEPAMVTGMLDVAVLRLMFMGWLVGDPQEPSAPAGRT
jgi:hypothetical protein